jgi:hypothetical protein
MTRDRVSVLPSSELAPPCPSHPSGYVPPPLLEPKWDDLQQSLAGEGTEGANADDWRESLALCILCGLY